MAALRRTASLSVRIIARQACLRTQASLSAAQRLALRQQIPRPAPRAIVLPVRWHSAPPGSTVYQFEDVRKFSDSPSPKRILIDVREPAEYEEGYIPGAINIPIKSQPDAMMLPAEEFEDRFGFAKPETDQEVVFYCKSGVRSSAAANFAKQHAGYTNVAEYRGSWLDWQKNGGPASKPGFSTWGW